MISSWVFHVCIFNNALSELLHDQHEISLATPYFPSTFPVLSLVIGLTSLLCYPFIVPRTSFVNRRILIFGIFRRFLLKLSKLTNCPFDDESSTAFSSVDLAIMNHSLAKRVTEKILNHGLSLNSNSNSSQTPSPSTKLLSQTMEERQTFSAGERRAIKVNTIPRIFML